MPFTGAGFVPVASAFAWLVLPICLLSGCSGGADGSGSRPAEVIESAEDRAARWAGLFAEAEGRAALWCTETQVATARLEGSGLEDKIELEVLQTATMLTAAKTRIEPEAERPIIITSYQPMIDTSGYDDVPAEVSLEVDCKFKSQDRLEGAFDLDLPGEEGSCDTMNAAALDWALAQVSEAERVRYRSEGAQLSFAEDMVAINGAAWYGTTNSYTPTADGYAYASSALLVTYDFDPALPDYARGVHYCKLMSPAQALLWVLARSFDEDPTALEQAYASTCPLPNPAAAGSCIFYFGASGQTYCEEYTGPNWTVESGRERCAGKTDADLFTPVFSTLSCVEREEETRDLDDDGVFRGQCVIQCGEEDEYRWNVYSDPSGSTAEESCPVDWVSAGGDSIPASPTAPSSVVPTVTGDGPFFCRYTNTFSRAEECKGYTGSAWTAQSATDGCASSPEISGGVLSDLPCDDTITLATCTVDRDTPDENVTHFFGGDLSTAQSGCVNFVDGEFETAEGVGEVGAVTTTSALMPEALAAMQDTTTVRVRPRDVDMAVIEQMNAEGGHLSFTPLAGASAGVIMYPGGRVDPRAFAPAAMQLAEAGFFVALVPMPGYLALGDGIYRADAVMDAHPEIGDWFIAGHSLGGAAAATYVHDTSRALRGLVLLGAYTDEDSDISGRDLPTLSIYGGNERFRIDEVEWAKFQDAKAYLPADTSYLEIPGGIHFGFTYAEDARGENAEITRAEQHAMFVPAIVSFARAAL